MNGYFSSFTELVRNTLARGDAINAFMFAIVAGFDKLPAENHLKQGITTLALDSGAANAYVVTPPYVPAGYVTGMSVVFVPLASNTGPSTINVAGLGVKAIKRFDGGDLASQEVIAGAVLELRYDGTAFRMMNGPPVTSPSYMPVNKAGDEMIGTLQMSNAYPLEMTDRTVAAVHADLTRGVSDAAFRLSVANGATGFGDGTEQARIGTRYVGTGWGAYLVFRRGASATDHGIGIFTSNAERVTVLPDGKVGIGQATPSQKLDVNGNLKVDGVLGFGNFNVQIQHGAGGANDIRFYTGSAQLAATFDNLQRLIVNSDVLSPNFYINGTAGTVGSSGATRTVYFSAGSGASVMRHYVDALLAATLDASGNFTSTGALTQFSDARLKTNVQPLTGSLAAVLTMQGVRYTRVADGSAQIGLIAQDVKDVRPEYVLEDDEDPEAMMSLAYPLIIADAIEAIKELHGLVVALTARVAVLEAGA